MTKCKCKFCLCCQNNDCQWLHGNKGRGFYKSISCKTQCKILDTEHTARITVRGSNQISH